MSEAYKNLHTMQAMIRSMVLPVTCHAMLWHLSKQIQMTCRNSSVIVHTLEWVQSGPTSCLDTSQTWLLATPCLVASMASAI